MEARAPQIALSKDWRRPLKKWLARLDPDTPRWFMKASRWIQIRKKISLALAPLSLCRYKAVELARSKVLICGIIGKKERHKETGEERYSPFFCQLRRIHLDCYERYRKGQGLELLHNYTNIAIELELKGFYHWVFTLPAEVRAFLLSLDPERQKKLLLKIRSIVAKVFRMTMGIRPGSRNIQPGYHVLYHPIGSSDPFVRKDHFHLVGMPAVINRKTGEIQKRPLQIHADLVKALYKDQLQGLLNKEGLHLEIKTVVVNLAFVPIDKPGRVAHLFMYNNRPLTKDVLDCIKRVDPELERFVCLLKDKQARMKIPIIKPFDAIVEGCRLAMSPLISVRQGYGFMAQPARYAEIIGIEEDVLEAEDPEAWEFVCSIRIDRQYLVTYDPKKKSPVYKLVLWIQEHEGLPWIKVDPSEIKGELYQTTTGKLWRGKK